MAAGCLMPSCWGLSIPRGDFGLHIDGIGFGLGVTPNFKPNLYTQHLSKNQAKKIRANS